MSARWTGRAPCWDQATQCWNWAGNRNDGAPARGRCSDYQATDISAGMIAIANEKYAAGLIPGLVFRTATVEALRPDAAPFNAVLGFNYLHLVRDLPGTLRRIHALLAAQGLFISKTPCVGDMNPLIRFALLPAMRAIGKAPHAGVFRASDLSQHISAAGFDVLATESHATTTVLPSWPARGRERLRLRCISQGCCIAASFQSPPFWRVKVHSSVVSVGRSASPATILPLARSRITS